MGWAIRLHSPAAPLLQALAKLSEVKVFDDEAAGRRHAGRAGGRGRRRHGCACTWKIDIAAERARLGKEVARLKASSAKAQGKLSNEAFVAKAPPAVIEQERKRIGQFNATLSQLQDQLLRLQSAAATGR